jgi:soluble P-type ATPase
MIRIEIPGAESLQLEYLVLDFNGTLACDGALLAAARGRLERLSQSVQIHVVTGDTFKRARVELADLRCRVHVLEAVGQTRAKLEYVQRLGPERTACIGNGRNDELMMEEAALGIAVVQAEGAAAATLAAADVVAHSIEDALDLLLYPQRLAATLRT